MKIENLRGFEESSLDLNRKVTLLVGPNNSGKTSLLRMLDWALNGDRSQFELDTVASAEAQRLLRPARATKKRARRLSLIVQVEDGRRYRKFQCDPYGLTKIRIGMRVSPYPSLRLNLGEATRTEGGDRDDAAYELFDELRESTAFTLIPASRHAASSSFGRSLDRAISDQLADVGIPRRGRAGVTRKTLDDSYKDLTALAEKLVFPLWDEVRDQLPAGLADSGSFRVESSSRELIEWVASRLIFTISTGSHDANQVLPLEVGSGLQSLLELAIAQLETNRSSQDCIIALEEPEAFLHPSAQRTLARQILSSSKSRKIVSTHSPLVVEEARFGETVIVQDHHFFEPRVSKGDEREEINTALMTRYGAEMVFSSSILLVEGEGDREFFEAIRRRLARIDNSGKSDRLIVVPTGSNSSFAPWIRLIRSYRDPSRAWNPLHWLALFDADSPSQIGRACRDGNLRIPPRINATLSRLDSANAGSDLAKRIKLARTLNNQTRAAGLRMVVSPGDLEWTMLSAASPQTIADIGEAIDEDSLTSAESLAIALGSKHCSSPKRRASKSPWIRGLIGRTLPSSEVSSDTRQVLARWLRGSMPTKQVRDLLAEDF